MVLEGDRLILVRQANEWKINEFQLFAVSPDVPSGYDTFLTGLSLIVAILATLAGQKDVVELLIEKGYDEKYGARPLRRFAHRRSSAGGSVTRS